MIKLLMLIQDHFLVIAGQPDSSPTVNRPEHWSTAVEQRCSQDLCDQFSHRIYLTGLAVNLECSCCG